jgi:DNA-binding CsgD family transcriptional regulator
LTSWALLECLEAASVWAVPRDIETAAVLLGATRALASRIGYSYEGGFHEPDFVVEPSRQIRRGLGPERAARAEHRGAAMDLTDAVGFAQEALTVELLRSGPSPAGPGANLSKRERELLALLAEGLTDNQIAEKLFISVRTVRSHLDRIREKTGFRRRAELTRLAVSAQLGPSSG